MTSSPDRIKPPCSWFGRCGGCTWQHVTYAAELAAKTNHLEETLHRLGEQNRFKLLDPLVGEDRYGTRNKLDFSAGRGSGGHLSLGLHGLAEGHPLLPVKQCMLGQGTLSARMAPLAKALDRAGVTAWDADPRKGLLRSVVLRRSSLTGEELVLFMVAREGQEQQLLQAVRSVAGDGGPTLRAAQAWVPGRKDTGRIHNLKALQGEPWLDDQVGPFRLRIPASAFLQVHSSLMEALYREVVRMADLRADDTVWELYCGIGSLSLFLQEKASAIYAWEGHEEAVQTAVFNARKNHAKTVQFARADLNKPFLPDAPAPDVLVVDPPRSGLSSAVRDSIRTLPVNTLIYVSCHAATLARDTRELCLENGFRLKEVRPVDLFPATLHCETIARFERG